MDATPEKSLYTFEDESRFSPKEKMTLYWQKGIGTGSIVVNGTPVDKSKLESDGSMLIDSGQEVLIFRMWVFPPIPGVDPVGPEGTKKP
ncbi:unnamed protein product [Clonostachys rosea f. rosea IK726]|uniref:Uncharacterized protein n=1 Tax=Clonostachys rosea f. rosea IK726 TaxID=1349383 RepID=A0ACA9UTB0_BIOOC|nr:unnamed protein product [Clonostachys rosea f. rosea IK726]